MFKGIGRRGSAFAAGMRGSGGKNEIQGQELRPILEGPLLAMEFVSGGKEVKWNLRHVQIFSDARVIVYTKKGDTNALRSETLTGEHFVSDARFENGWQISDFETILYFASQTPEEKSFWMHAVAGVIRRLMEPMDALPPQYAQVAMHRHSTRINQGPAFDPATVPAVDAEQEQLSSKSSKDEAETQSESARNSVRLNEESINDDASSQNEIKKPPPPPPPPRALHLELSGASETPSFVPAPQSEASHSLALSTIETERDEALAAAAREKGIAEGLARELETASKARDAALNALETARSDAESALTSETERAEVAEEAKAKLSAECMNLKRELTDAKSRLDSFESLESSNQNESQAALLEEGKLRQAAEEKAISAEDRAKEAEQRESSLQKEVAKLRTQLAQAEDEARRANTALMTEETARRSAEDRLQSASGKEEVQKQLDDQAAKWLKALSLERDRTQAANAKLKTVQAQLAARETDLDAAKSSERRAHQQVKEATVAASKANESSESVLKAQLKALEQSLEKAKRQAEQAEAMHANSNDDKSRTMKQHETQLKQLRAQLTSAQSKSGLTEAARAAETKRANDALSRQGQLETQLNAAKAELDALKKARLRQSLPRPAPAMALPEEHDVASSSTPKLVLSKTTPVIKASPQQKQKKTPPPPPPVPAVTLSVPPPQINAKEVQKIKPIPPKAADSANADSVSATAKLWDSRAQKIQKDQKTNTFSKFYDPKATTIISPKDGEYGTPPPGSATAARWEKGKKWVDEQIDSLIKVIREIGNTDDNCTVVTFGTLFYAYADISDSLVGILMRAKKRKRLFYEGDMLFQSKDDHIIITCPLVPVAA